MATETKSVFCQAKKVMRYDLRRDGRLVLEITVAASDRLMVHHGMMESWPSEDIATFPSDRSAEAVAFLASRGVEDAEARVAAELAKHS